VTDLICHICGRKGGHHSMIDDGVVVFGTLGEAKRYLLGTLLGTKRDVESAIAEVRSTTWDKLNTGDTE
jgi:hypothetical protein